MELSRFFLYLFILFVSQLALADESGEDTGRGKIVKILGQVTVINDKGIEQIATHPNYVIRANETIVTGSGGFAVVRLNDSTLAVLNENSRLRVKQTSWLSYLGGKVYFTYRKLFGRIRRVNTPYATIGVRGTTFIVDDEDKSVALKEGRLEIASHADSYEIHRSKVKDDFESYKRELRDGVTGISDEFEEYSAGIQSEFVEYKKEFVLESNHVIEFEGMRVTESVMSDKQRAAFKELEAVAGELLNEFHGATD